MWQGEEQVRQFEDTSSRPEDLLRKRELPRLVEEATARLSDHHREVFVLRDIEGKSYGEIAEIISTNVGTVKSRLSRARSSLADIIRPWVD
jgi:RNA polymerase sigma-70 factor, ECF subfamily